MASESSPNSFVSLSWCNCLRAGVRRVVVGQPGFRPMLEDAYEPRHQVQERRCVWVGLTRVVSCQFEFVRIVSNLYLAFCCVVHLSMRLSVRARLGVSDSGLRFSSVWYAACPSFPIFGHATK